MSPTAGPAVTLERRHAKPRPTRGAGGGPATEQPSPHERYGHRAAPPSHGQPSVARAGEMVKTPEAAPGVVARARMSVALQHAVGNAALGTMTAGRPGGVAELPTSDAPAVESRSGGGVVLKMKPPPPAMSGASRKRLAASGAAAARTAVSAASLPPASAHVAAARVAVTPPPAENAAVAQAGVIAALGERPKPSPQIEELCAKIHQVIEAKTPDDERALDQTDPEDMAKAAGDELKQNVRGGVEAVDRGYAPIAQTPEAGAGQPGAPLPPPPGAAPTAAIGADAAVPDPIPAADMSLDADAAAARAKTQAAGMDTDAAKLVQTGPVAEAREAQAELDQTAREDPAQVAAQQHAAFAQAGADMAALQKSALDALAASRRATVTSTSGRQLRMVGSEESMRAQAGAAAHAIFVDAQQRVQAQLAPVQQTATNKWDAGVKESSATFKRALKTVQDWIDERHSGRGGTVLSVVDRLTGLPHWILDAYARAEELFGEEICGLAREISVDVNTVVMVCEGIIADARKDIDDVFARLPASLRGWAAEQQASFAGQLDGLSKSAHDVQTNFTRDLVKSASQAFKEAHDALRALRDKAKGFLGRLADAVDSFLSDPGKFIIEGLLSLLGIPPAAFWAVVAKIEKVVGDIADDPLGFAGNLLKAVGRGFGQFFDNIGSHLLRGFIDWLTGGLASAGVTLPSDFSLKSIVTFMLELMGITWPRIRKLLAKHVGEKNVALIEKTYALVAELVALGPAGIFELLKEKLNPQALLDQIIKAAVDYMIGAVIKAVTARILLLFNPVGAIVQALEAIYKVLKWIFVNAARIFKLVETIVDGIADIIAGNIGGMANAIESALAQLIPPVIGFLADYFGFGDLPSTIKEKIEGFQSWIEGILDGVIGWLVEKGKALLSAVGLGGKREQKKDAKSEAHVGKTVTWSDGVESHKLWIERIGSSVAIMAASHTQLAAQMLDAYGDAARSSEHTSEAREIIEKARELLATMASDAKKALAPAESGAAGQSTAAAEEKVESEEDKLVAYLIRLHELLGTTGDATSEMIEMLPDFGGIYEFRANSKKKYVGQSSNIRRRIKQHIKSGKLCKPDVPTVWWKNVGGSKTCREIAEQERIDSYGGIKNLANLVNPLGAARKHLRDPNNPVRKSCP